MKFKKANTGHNLVLNSQEKANLVAALHTLTKLRELAVRSKSEMLNGVAASAQYDIKQLLDDSKIYNDLGLEVEHKLS